MPNNTDFKLLYQASRDGFGASDFHSKCNGIFGTFTLIKSMDSYIFGGYNRAFQILRAYAMFEPDSTTNCSGTYSELWWPYCMNIEKITYVTTNTWQVFFVEALQDSSTYLNATVDRGFYGVVVAANGTATGPVPQIVRVFDTYPTSFKIELSNEDSSGSRINILVYK
jgi:hypothetical protein